MMNHCYYQALRAARQELADLRSYQPLDDDPRDLQLLDIWLTHGLVRSEDTGWQLTHEGEQKIQNCCFISNPKPVRACRAECIGHGHEITVYELLTCVGES